MASNTTDQPGTAQPAEASTRVRLVIVSACLAAILPVSGGDFVWWQAWVYAVMAVVISVGCRLWADLRHPGLLAERDRAVVSLGGRLWAGRRHPGLLAERNKAESAEGVKPWDKALAPLMLVTPTLLLYSVAGLDHRFGGSPAFPTWLTILGLGLVLLGWAVSTWAMVENRFFSAAVRIQTDRGHVVCDTGPYRFVRHPGYAGLFLTLPGSVLALASLWAIIPVILALAVAVVRTVLEDRTLQEELPGYREYAQRTRFRLIPGIY